MARSKTVPTSAPPNGIEHHLAVLDHQEARQRDQEAEEIEALRQSWAPALAEAKTILAELSALETASAPTLEYLARRDFSSLPPTARVLNAVATIERTSLEIQQHFGHTAEDLRRISKAIEQLNERSRPLLQANALTYRELLGFYRHAPQGVREMLQRLERTVATLTTVLDSMPDETTMSVRRLPAPQPLTPEVEMA